MLAGVGPVPAVLFVVAADEGWMPQSTEHLAVLDALGVRHALLAVTRADLADPEPATAAALELISRSSLGYIDSVAVSAVTGAGMDELRHRLSALAQSLPRPDPDADVRLWVDRSFAVGGAGTVVTGTLAAGTVRTGDELVLATGRTVRVRAVQSLGESVDAAVAVARVAVNLRGVNRSEIRRGESLLTPDAWLTSELIDVVVHEVNPRELPAALMLHIGSAAVPVHLRPLGTMTARVRLAVPLPLRIGDRAVLRDPGRHVMVAGVDVLDVRPPALRRRGAARQRGAQLDQLASGSEMTRFQLRQHGFVRAGQLRAMGLPALGPPLVGDWHADTELLARLAVQAKSVVDEWVAEHPLQQGIPVGALRQRLELPDAELVAPLALATGLVVDDGLVRRDAHQSLPAPVAAAVAQLVEDLRDAPFAAPEAHRLRELGLGPRELAAVVRAGLLTKITDGIFLLPGATEHAAELLATLEQPFTLSTARQALHTTRRVAVPLLELLDRRGTTERFPDGTRVVRATTER
jgi:selenocysteine-specific elongation factor